MASRSMQRMQILLTLLGTSQRHLGGKYNHLMLILVYDIFHFVHSFPLSVSDMGANIFCVSVQLQIVSDATINFVKVDFQRVLLSRLAEALAQREEMMGSPKDWMSLEAKKRQALQEGGTLR